MDDTIHFRIAPDVLKEAESLFRQPDIALLNTRLLATHPRTKPVVVEFSTGDWMEMTRGVALFENHPYILENTFLQCWMKDGVYKVQITDHNDVLFELKLGFEIGMTSEMRQAFAKVKKMSGAKDSKIRNLKFREFVNWWAFGADLDNRRIDVRSSTKDVAKLAMMIFVTRWVPGISNVCHMLIQESAMKYAYDDVDRIPYTVSGYRGDEIRSVYVDLNRLTVPSEREDHSGRRHREHLVDGHWAYSKRSGNVHCQHDWEYVDGHEHRQRCRKCNKLRWWRKSHSRGDATLGIITRAERKVTL